MYYEWRFDDSVLHCLRQRVVHNDPGEIGPILILRRCAEVKPCDEASASLASQLLVQGGKRFAPPECLVMDVMPFIVQDHQVLNALHSIQHRCGRSKCGLWGGTEQPRDRVT